MEVKTGGSSRIFIDSFGNIGMGTTVPTAKLNIIGSLYADGSQISGKADDTTSLGSTSRRFASLYMASTLDYGTSLTITGPGGIDTTFDALGNVGIGITNPDANLQVVGDLIVSSGDAFEDRILSVNVPADPYYSDAEVIINGDLEVYNSVQIGDELTVSGSFNISDIQYPIGSNLSIGQSGYPNQVTIQDVTGNVGIGTTDPSVELEVTGDVSISGALTVSSQIFYINTINHSTSDLNIVGSGGTSVTVAPSGRVGIGTTEPDTDLNVNGGFIVASGEAFEDRILSVNTTDPYYADAEVIVNGDMAVTLETETRTLVVNETATITGDLTANSVYVESEILGALNNSSTLGGSSSSRRFNKLYMSSYIGVNATIDHAAGSNFSITQGGTTNFTIYNGNVGIGVTTPSTKLEVNGNLKLSTGASINEFSIDGTLAGNSDTAVPTEKAVKTYIGSMVVVLLIISQNGRIQIRLLIQQYLIQVLM